MSRYPQFLCFAGALLFGATLLAADAPPATNAVTSAQTSFDAFRILSERNIFNQNRTARSAVRDTPKPRRAPVVQSLSLVGTMSYAKGSFAFFDGTSSDSKKPVKAGDRIAGYQVKEVKTSGVTITNDSQQFDLKVGQQLRREDEGEWQLSAAPIVAASASNSETKQEGTGSSAGSGSEEEALRRLMEKRAKELNQ